MDKQYLLFQLEHTAHNFVLGLASCTLLASKEVYPLLEQGTATFGSYEVDFKQLIPLLTSSNEGPVVIMELLKLHLRALIKETFEHIKAYARQSNQLPAMHAAHWYHFARVIRNCLSHDVKFTFTRADKALLPLTWENHTIVESMEWTDLDFKFFSPADGWRLFSQMRDWAYTTLV